MDRCTEDSIASVARAAVLALAASAALLAPATTAFALPDLGREWIEVRSGPLVAISSLSVRDTERITERVQHFRHDVFGPGRPFRAAGGDTMKLFLFENEDLFEVYEPHGYDAYYQPADGVDYLLLKQQRWEDSLPLAFSMEALHLLGDASVAMPVWLRRGLADFYSTYRTDGDRVRVGHRIPWKFDVLKGGNPIPWARVLEIGEFSPEIHDPDRLQMFSAQAWILVHYLVTETPGGENAVARYVSRLDAGDDRDVAFAGTFAFPRAELAERGERHARGRGFDATAFPRPGAPTTASTRAALPRERLLCELGEMLANLHSGANSALLRERAELAKEHFDAALALDAASAAAQRGLGLVRLRNDDPDGALPFLRTAVERDPSDLRAHYLLAEALVEPFRGRRIRFSVRRKDPPPAIAEARRHLLACLQLDPDRGDVHLRLGETYLHDPGDPSAGIRTLQAVLPLYPGRRDVIDTLVLLLLKAGQPEAAFPYLDAGDGEDPRLQSARGMVVDETLRLAGKATANGDLARADALVERVRQRGAAWGLTRPQITTLASFDGLKESIREAEASGESTEKPAALSPKEAERQYQEYRRALELCSEKKYKQAVDILDGLLAGPNDEAMHESIVTLREQARYNHALKLFERGEYRQALEIARDVKNNTPRRGIASLAQALVKNCKRALEE